MTHKDFIRAVRHLAVDLLADPRHREAVLSAKLMYGAGLPLTRETCFFGTWDSGRRRDLVEVGAFGEESVLQLACTTIHELAHVLGGHAAGHGTDWKAAARPGPVHAEAAGQTYSAVHFHSLLRAQILALPVPNDGRPVRSFASRPAGPCRQRIGTRGSRSRGIGSGSRLRLWICGCNPPVKVRVARDVFRAVCQDCRFAFKRASYESTTLKEKLI